MRTTQKMSITPPNEISFERLSFGIVAIHAARKPAQLG